MHCSLATAEQAASSPASAPHPLTPHPIHCHCLQVTSKDNKIMLTTAGLLLEELRMKVRTRRASRGAGSVSCCHPTRRLPGGRLHPLDGAASHRLPGAPCVPQGAAAL